MAVAVEQLIAIRGWGHRLPPGAHNPSCRSGGGNVVSVLQGLRPGGQLNPAAVDLNPAAVELDGISATQLASPKPR
jgi:hypothetical protein